MKVCSLDLRFFCIIALLIFYPSIGDARPYHSFQRDLNRYCPSSRGRKDCTPPPATRPIISPKGPIP
ncbi:hypothetical protein CsatB_027730 [Cannabis sativa]